MRLQPPALPQQLETAVPFAEALALARGFDEPVHGFSFGEEPAGEAPFDLHGAEFSACAFHKASLANAVADGAHFTDVLFDGCDLSGLHAAEASFTRCAFRACRLTGANLGAAALYDVRVAACRADYLCCAQAFLRNVFFEDCRLENAAFSELARKSAFAFAQCALTGADFLHTPLRGVDFTTCDIDGLALEGSELRGAVVTPAQACELARLLGVVIQG